MPQMVGINAAQTIDQELPCSQCRYLLRGLPPTSQCPECGQPIRVSIAAAELKAKRRRGFEYAHPQWLLQVAQGMLVSVLALALAILASLVPTDAYRRHSELRPWMLGWFVTAWVLSLYGAWKLSARDESLSEGMLRRLIRQLSRVSLVALLAMPVTFGLRVGWHWDFPRWVLLLVKLTAPAAVILPPLVASVAAWRVGRIVLAVLFGLMAGGQGFVGYLAIDAPYLWGPSSMDLMYVMPHPVAGLPHVLGFVLGEAVRYEHFNDPVLIFLACLGALVAVPIWFFTSVHRGRRKLMAGSPRSSDASSRP